MTQLTIIAHGDGAAVVIPGSVLESTGLAIGDVLDATLGDRELILRSVANAARRQLFHEITQEVLERRRDAYQRLA